MSLLFSNSANNINCVIRSNGTLKYKYSVTKLVLFHLAQRKIKHNYKKLTGTLQRFFNEEGSNLVSGHCYGAMKLNRGNNLHQLLNSGISFNLLKNYIPNLFHVRTFSTDNKYKSTFPVLTEGMPPVAYPNFFYTLQNWFSIYFIIRPTLDKNFDLPEFLVTSKKVIEIVSSRLAANDTESLEGLVTVNVLEQLQRNLPKYDPSTRQDLYVSSEDVCSTFPHFVVVQKDEADSNQSTLEITTIYHVVRGFNDLKNKRSSTSLFLSPSEIGDFAALNKKIIILNYKFIRHYYNGIADEWTISGLNHYKLNDIQYL